MYKAHENILPLKIQFNFVKIEHNNLKGKEIFVKPTIWTNLKERSTSASSVQGIKLQNNLKIDVKTARTLCMIKTMTQVSYWKK